MPDRALLDRYIDGIYERRWLTNNGPLVCELTNRLEAYLGVTNLLLVANGTLALQIAFKLLELKGEAVTTPFTFAATSSALLWEGVRPRYADIDPTGFNIDPQSLEARINTNTSAIVPVHVYGNPCRTEEIKRVASRHGLPVIYDAAHAFGVTVGGESVLRAGDIATLSFHATKLFHTVEGGALIIRDDAQFERAREMINFGFDAKGRIARLGNNSKMSELHAAVGLATLDSIDSVISTRRMLIAEYRRGLAGKVTFQEWAPEANECAAYMPILLSDAQQTQRVCERLNEAGVYPRRYFSPALHEAALFEDGTHAPVAADIAGRVLCLPIYAELETAQVLEIVRLIVAELERTN